MSWVDLRHTCCCLQLPAACWHLGRTVPCLPAAVWMLPGGLPACCLDAAHRPACMLHRRLVLHSGAGWLASWLTGWLMGGNGSTCQAALQCCRCGRLLQQTRLQRCCFSDQQWKMSFVLLLMCCAASLAVLCWLAKLERGQRLRALKGRLDVLEETHERYGAVGVRNSQQDVPHVLLLVQLEQLLEQVQGQTWVIAVDRHDRL